MAEQITPQTGIQTAFNNVAEKIQNGAGLLGLAAPEFKTPPGISGHTRTLRKIGEQQWIVSVEVKERLTSVVIADMIEGVCAANDLDEIRSGEVRTSLWENVVAKS